MYATISTPAATWADSAVTDNTGPVRRVPRGGRSKGFTPVLCAGPVASAVFGLSNLAAGDGSGESVTNCPESSLNFTAAVTYIPLGRMTVNRAEVAEHASVEDLASALRAA